MASCLGFAIDIIEPCGFLFDDRKLKRSSMDYFDDAVYMRHNSWNDFFEKRKGRLIMLEPDAPQNYLDFSFSKDDLIMVGQESVGIPDAVLKQADVLLKIPMLPQKRSLNVAISAAIVMGEALRQTNCFP